MAAARERSDGVRTRPNVDERRATASVGHGGGTKTTVIGHAVLARGFCPTPVVEAARSGRQIRARCRSVKFLLRALAADYSLWRRKFSCRIAAAGSVVRMPRSKTLRSSDRTANKADLGCACLTDRLG